MLLWEPMEKPDYICMEKWRKWKLQQLIFLIHDWKRMRKKGQAVKASTEVMKEAMRVHALVFIIKPSYSAE